MNPIRASSAAGASSSSILKNHVSARVMGMGGAFTAISDDVSAIHFNPAGLATLKRQQLGMMYDHGLADIKMEFIGYALPILRHDETLEATALPRSMKQFVGVSVLASQLGKMDVIRTDAGGAFQDSRIISAGSDMVVSISYALQVDDDALNDALNQSKDTEFHVGATARYWKSTLAEQYSARTGVFDFGFLRLKKNQAFRWGLLVQNMGTGLRFKEKSDPLPLNYRLGAAWQGCSPAIGAQVLTVAVDGRMDRENKKGVSAGLEYWSRSFVGGRAGYQWDQGNQSRWTAGLGIKLPGYSAGNLTLDYGFQLIGDAGSTQRVSLNYEFGAPR